MKFKNDDNGIIGNDNDVKVQCYPGYSHMHISFAIPETEEMWTEEEVSDVLKLRITKAAKILRGETGKTDG